MRESRFRLRGEDTLTWNSHGLASNITTFPPGGQTTLISALQGFKHEDVVLDQIQVQRDVYLTSEAV